MLAFQHLAELGRSACEVLSVSALALLQLSVAAAGTDTAGVTKKIMMYSGMSVNGKEIDIIDTPGIKGFGLVRMEKETLHHHFPEMFRLLPNCKFHNCRHLDEPGCAVRAALETGEVDDERYRNYRNMVEEFDEGPYRAGGKKGNSGI